MSIAIEVSGSVQAFDNTVVEAQPPVQLNHENVHSYIGSLVAVQPMDREGKPVQVDAMGCGQLKQPAPDDTEAWGKFHKTLKNGKDKIDSPFTIGRVEPHPSGSYFFVVPERKPDITTATPPRLFSFGGALVLPLVQLSV